MVLISLDYFVVYQIFKKSNVVLLRLDNPWRAFTGSWSLDTVAKNLGINSSFVHKDHCYVLVRLSRFRDNVKLSRIPNNVNLAEVVAQEIDDIRVGDVASVVRFIKKYGSHYIDSYVTGNALYQVIFSFVLRSIIPIPSSVGKKFGRQNCSKMWL